jgi:hypothetical protein
MRAITNRAFHHSVRFTIRPFAHTRRGPPAEKES